jgi:ATP-binding cassette subfamily B protein
VAGVGTHPELLENNEIYREIVASQVSLEEVA